MIKAKGRNPDGTDIVILGITEDNVKRLQAGNPILVHGKDMDIPFDIMIEYGAKKEDLSLWKLTKDPGVQKTIVGSPTRAEMRRDGKEL